MAFLQAHKAVERNATILLALSLVVVTVGGVVEMVPLFFFQSTIEEVDGVRPYTPLELVGREVYLREGCYNCHSQMIRPMRDEVERYGPYSLAAESMYDHPFQWGSKRTGPDLARVGGRYSDDWHVQHLIDPRSVVPESIMPPYAFLMDRRIDEEHVGDLLATHRLVGVPYTDEQLAHAAQDLRAQSDPDADVPGFEERWPDAVAANRDLQPGLSEMDALVAYLQVLGTMVDFSTFTPDESR